MQPYLLDGMTGVWSGWTPQRRLWSLVLISYSTNVGGL